MELPAAGQNQPLIHVAIVEDDLGFRQALSEVIESTQDLRLAGTAGTRAEGLALLQGAPADVLLVDLGLPDGSGIDVIRAAVRQWASCSIMVSTNFGDESHVIRSIEAGASGYLLKDSSPAKMVDEIRSLASGGSPISPLIARQVLARFRQIRPAVADRVGSPEEAAPLLSAREKEVLELITKGFTANEIARLMVLSPFTVRSFVRRIYSKLNVTSKAEAIYEARNQGILDADSMRPSSSGKATIEQAIHRSSKNVPSSIFSIAALIFSVALLAALGVFLSLAVSGIERSNECLHLTQASWQTIDTPQFTPPPVLLDSRTLPQAWHDAALPLAWHSATSDGAAPGAVSVDHITWVKLAVNGQPSTTGTLAIYGVRVKTDGPVAIYVNGKLVQRTQQRGQQWNSLFTPLWIELDPSAGNAPVREIVLRLEHTSPYAVALSSLWLGPADALRGRYQTRQWLQRGLPAMLNAAFLAVGIFALFVWLRRRDEVGYLLFFNLSAIAFAAHLHYYVDLPIANDWFGWLVLNSFCWLLTAAHFFLRLLHGHPLRWLGRAMVAASVLIGVATLPLPWALPNTRFVLAGIYAIELLMAVVVGLVGGIYSWRSSKEGRLVVVAVAICVLLGVSDWLLHNNLVGPEGWFLGAYTNGVTFIFFGLLMYRRYVNAIEEVERVNASLAERLLLREAELEQSHQRLREIEQRQLLSDERQRLMQDMHDGLGSTLISAIRSVEQGRMSDAEVSQILKDCMDDLKLAIDSMEPVEADLLLLLATLRFRLEPRMEGANVALRWDVEELPALHWLDPSSALNILRIVQESVANILRHTRATVIRVATAIEDAGVHVIIEDNGQGFDVDATLALGKGRGLHNQQRRAQSIDGRVAWTSGDAGTRFTLWLPLRRDARATGNL